MYGPTLTTVFLMVSVNRFKMSHFLIWREAPIYYFLRVKRMVDYFNPSSLGFSETNKDITGESIYEVMNTNISFVSQEYT